PSVGPGNIDVSCAVHRDGAAVGTGFRADVLGPAGALGRIGGAAGGGDQLLHEDVIHAAALIGQLDDTTGPGVEVVVLGGIMATLAPVPRDVEVATAVYGDSHPDVASIAAHAPRPGGVAAGIELPHKNVRGAGPAG